MNSLDRILSDHDSPRPSAGFHASVMAAIRQVEGPSPLEFPWRWLAGAGAVATGLVAWVALDSTDWMRWAAEPTAIWSIIAVLASAVGAWISVELAEA